MCVCVFVCVSVYIYIYIHISITFHIEWMACCFVCSHCQAAMFAIVCRVINDAIRLDAGAPKPITCCHPIPNRCSATVYTMLQAQLRQISGFAPHSRAGLTLHGQSLIPGHDISTCHFLPVFWHWETIPTIPFNQNTNPKNSAEFNGPEMCLSCPWPITALGSDPRSLTLKFLCDLFRLRVPGLDQDHSHFELQPYLDMIRYVSRCRGFKPEFAKQLHIVITLLRSVT